MTCRYNNKNRIWSDKINGSDSLLSLWLFFYLLCLSSFLTSLFTLFLLLLCSLRASRTPKETNQKREYTRNTMLLGKRQRPPIKRTTSLSEIKFDLNQPSEQEPSDHQIQLVTIDEHRQVHQRLLDQRLLAMVSPRGTQRRHSADYSEDFLRSCSLCKRHLVPGRDIYMYRYKLKLTLSVLV